MTDSVKEAVDFLERLADSKNWTGGYPSAPAICDDHSAEGGVFNALVSRDATRHAKSIRARIAELEKDRPEGVTVGEFTDKIGSEFFADGWSGLTPNDQFEIVLFMLRMYPNGIRIVQDKEGGV